IGRRIEAAQKILEDLTRQREEAANGQRESIAEATRQAEQLVSSSLSSAQEQWQSHLSGELEAAHTRWQIAGDNAFAGAQEKAYSALVERATGLRSELQNEVERQTESVRWAAAQARNETEQHAAGLRESLNGHASQIEAALARASEASERLESFSA